MASVEQAQVCNAPWVALALGGGRQGDMWLVQIDPVAMEWALDVSQERKASASVEEASLRRRQQSLGENC